MQDLIKKISIAEDASNAVSKMLRLHVSPDGGSLSLDIIVRGLAAVADGARALLDEVQVCKNDVKR